MDFIIIVVSMVAALWLSTLLQRRLLAHDPEARDQLRRRFRVWCFRAAAVALVTGVILAIYLRAAAAHG